MDGSAPRARVSGYSHVGLAVTDLDAARTFYTRHLGLRELPRPDLGIPGVWLQVGNLQLHLFHSDTPLPPNTTLAHVALYVAPDDFDETMDELHRVGTPFTLEPVDSDGRRTAFVTDPSGNPIELSTLGPLPDPHPADPHPADPQTAAGVVGS